MLKSIIICREISLFMSTTLKNFRKSFDSKC
nr:ALPV-305 [Albatrosspox virus]